MFWNKKRYKFALDEDIPLLTPVESLSFIVFDTEATGFHIASDDRLLEIGAVYVKNLEVTDETFQTYINPQREIPVIIKELTGITEDTVQEAPLAVEGIEQFIQYVEQYPCCSLVAHCMSFDLMIIEQELKRIRATVTKPRVVDTLDLLQLLSMLKHGKDLEDYAKEFDVPVFTRHTAIGDANTTAHLLCQILRRIKRRYRTWGELLFALESRQRASAMY